MQIGAVRKRLPLLNRLRAERWACRQSLRRTAETCAAFVWSEAGLSHCAQIGKEILPELLSSGGSPKALVESKGLLQISDEGAVQAIVDAVCGENEKQASAPRHAQCIALTAGRRLRGAFRRCADRAGGRRGGRQVLEFRSGRDKVKGFFVGQIMKRSGGRANPVLVDKLLMARLRGD